MKILLDNGHGVETPGKRSPDGKLREYAYCREIARRIEHELRLRRYDVERIVTEDADIALSERVARANRIYADTGKRAILVSIHVNAAGGGAQWMSARGWSVFVDPTASAKSKRIADSLALAAIEKGAKVRRCTPQELYWTQNLYICKHTHCPAVLTENFFQDNREDVDFLLSDAGQQTVVDIHVGGIINYLISEGV